MKKIALSDVAEYITEKISVDEILLEDYISTENMIAEKGGICLANSIPKSGKVVRFRKGDVLVSNIRPYFKKIWLANRDGGCSNDVLVFRSKVGYLPEYIYYVLSEDYFFEYATRSAKGTKMPRGDKDAIMRYLVNDFSFEEQKKITDILKVIDDKVELNRKLNANLEEMVSTRFREIYSMDSVLKGIMSDIIKFSNGKKKPDETGDVPIYGGNGILGYANKSNYKDIIVVGRVGAYCGSLYYEPGLCWVSDNAIAAKSKNNHNYYCYELLKTYNLNNMHIGSSQPLLTQSILNAIEIKMFDDDLISSVDTWAKSFYTLIYLNNLENKRLEKIRELLLPRLMSGELHLPETEEV